MSPEIIKQLRSEGYADEEIAKSIAESDKAVNALLGEGYSPTEVLDSFTLVESKQEPAKAVEVVAAKAPKQRPFPSTPPTQEEAEANMMLARAVGGLDESARSLSVYHRFKDTPRPDWGTYATPEKAEARLTAAKVLGGVSGAAPVLEGANIPMASVITNIAEAANGEITGERDASKKIEALNYAMQQESIPRIAAGIATEIGVSEGIKFAAAKQGAKSGVQGAALGYISGALTGGAIGSLTAQGIEGRDKISWGRVIADSFLNLIPGAEIKGGPKILTNVSRISGKAPILTSTGVGAVAGAGTNTLEQLFEGEGIDGGEVAKAAATTAALGAGLGAASKALGGVFKKLFQSNESELEKLAAKGDPDAIGYLNFLLEDVPDELMPKLNSKGYVQTIIEKGKAWAAPSKLLGDDVMTAVRRAENAPKAAKQLGEVLGKRIDDVVDQAVAKHGPEIEGKLWAYINGETEEIPSQVKNITDYLVASRKEVRDLQFSLLENHYTGKRVLEKPLKEAIEGSLNRGDYLTRSYRFFEDPLYKPDQKMFDKAVRAMVRDGVDKDVAKTYLLNLNERRAGNMGEIISYMHSAKAGVLKGRNNDLPMEVRQYLGEYTKPGEKLAATQSKLSKLVEYDKADQTIAQSLRYSGLAKTAAEAGPDWVPLKMRSSQAKAGEEVQGFIVDGQPMYVAPDTYKALNEVYGIQQAGEAGVITDLYHSAIAASKASKVLWNPPSYMVQIYGNIAGNANSLNNPLLGLKRGVLAGTSTFSRSGIIDKIPVVRNLASRASVKTLLRNKRYQELGLVDQSLAFNDFLRSAKTGSGKFSTITRGIFAPFGKGYSAFDTTLRIVGFENFKKTLVKATGAKTQQQIARVEEEAASIINDIYPNYAFLNDKIKAASQHGVPLSQFASFTMELMRNQFNHVRIARDMANGSFAQELAQRTGLEIVNPAVLQRKGGYMIGGLAAMHGLGYAAIKAYNRTEGGMSEEKEQAWRETGAMPWDKESNTLLKADEDGDTVYSTNASYLLPHAQMSGWIGAALRGESITDSASKFGEAVIGDLVGEGSFAARTFIAAMNNRNIDTGRRISHREDMTGKMGEILAWAMNDAFEPGIAREVRKARNQTAETTIARQAGIRINKQSFRTGLQIKTKNIKDSLTELSSEATGLKFKLEDKALTPEQYEQEYQRLNTSYRQQAEMLSKHFQNSRTWGLDDNEIVTLMKGAGVGSTKILDAMQGIVRDLPREKTLDARGIYEKDFVGKGLNEQMKMLKGMDNQVMAIAIKDIIKGEARKQAVGETVLDSLYKAIPSTTGERARRIMDDLSKSTNPEALESRFLKSGVIDRNTAYHMKLLRDAK